MQSVIESSQRLLFLSRGKCYASLQNQSVRFYRKPRWIPIAKSKKYKTIEHDPQPLLELEEMKLLMGRYKLYSKSLWSFQKHISEDEEARNASHAKDVSEDVELERIFSETESDNANVRAIREQELSEEWRLIEQGIKDERSKFEEEELKKLELTEQEIQTQMERLKTAIKEEDLDEIIAKALAVQVDYNFGIDKDGKLYKGRHNHDKGESLDSSSIVGPITFQPASSEPASTSTPS